MNYLNKILKLRRQNDQAKIMLLLFCIAGVFFIVGITDGVKLFQMKNSSMVYHLERKESKEWNKEALAELRQAEHVLAASREEKQLVTFQGAWGEWAVPCFVLEESYMQEAYKIAKKSEMPTFYLTEKAYEDYLKKSKQPKGQKNTTGGLQCKYIAEGKSDKSDGNTARLVLLPGTKKEDACAYRIADFQTEHLKNGQYRVLVTRGNQVAAFEKMGYTIRNSAKIEKTKYRIEIRKCHMTYRILLAALFFLFAYYMWRDLKKLINFAN